MNISRHNCAGQGCPERDGCKRFEERRIARFARTPHGPEPVYEWASFDIERLKFGDCRVRIEA